MSLNYAVQALLANLPSYKYDPEWRHPEFVGRTIVFNINSRASGLEKIESEKNCLWRDLNPGPLSCWSDEVIES